MRFQLDPRAKPPERPAPPAPPAPSSASAAPGSTATPPLPAQAPPPAGTAPPAPAPAAPAAPFGFARAGDARNRNRLYLAIGLVLLLAAGTAGALYFLEKPPFEYPRRYLLEGNEIPSRMELADVPDDVKNELGIEENPGRVQEEDRDAFALGGFAPEPVDAWAQVLSPEVAYEPVLVAALKFEDEDDARRWVGLASNRCGSMASGILRDGEVVVAVAARGSATSQAYAMRVVETLMDEAPLTNACAR